MVSQAELILRVITLRFLVLSQFFRDGMGPFKINQRFLDKYFRYLLVLMQNIFVINCHFIIFTCHLISCTDCYL